MPARLELAGGVRRHRAALPSRLTSARQISTPGPAPGNFKYSRPEGAYPVATPSRAGPPVPVAGNRAAGPRLGRVW
jgi:hypothetical protein